MLHLNSMHTPHQPCWPTVLHDTHGNYVILMNETRRKPTTDPRCIKDTFHENNEETFEGLCPYFHGIVSLLHINLHWDADPVPLSHGM